MSKEQIIFSIIQSFGSIATVFSVLWAIIVYRAANEEKGYIEAKNNILKIPQLCKELDLLLTEPFFAAIGNSISDELKGLFGENQSMEEYSDFLLKESSKNYKAIAIYAGLKKCEEVNQIKSIIKEIEESTRNILIRFPLVGRVIQKLMFYITTPAEHSISSHILNKSLAYVWEDGETNTLLKEALQDAASTSSKELYFKEIAIYLTNISRAHLSGQHLGQRTIDLSRNMLSIICKTFGGLDESGIKRNSKKDRKKFKKFSSLDNKHAVEDAMIIIKIYRKLFQESEWERLVEYKGRIIELMEDE